MNLTLPLVALLVPAVGAGLTWAVGPAGRGAARLVALVTTLVTLAVCSAIIYAYPGEGWTALVDYNWIGGPVDIGLRLGLDGLSLWLFGLTAVLMVTAVLVSWEAIDDGAPGYYALLLLLETGMLGVFLARDIIFFYLCFEATLIPLFFLIGIWGHDQRRYAAVKFFLFTLAGSVITFLGLLAIAWRHSLVVGGPITFNIETLTAGLQAHPMSPGWQLAIFLALFAGFAIKVPLFPLHTWLPLAHVEAPTAGSVLLAGVLLKIGTYGFVRFNLPMFPEASAACMPWILALAAAGIVYGALVALVQADMKRLIAYSSVSHLGYCMLGMFAFNPLGLEGSVLQMVNHGLSTGGLFACVGMLYERYHTREISQYGGIAQKLPILSFFMLVFTFSSIGLPGLNGFAGEILILVGMFQRAWDSLGSLWGLHLMTIAVLGVLGVVLGAWYMLYLVQRVFFGKVKEPHGDGGHGGHGHGPVKDLSLCEILALAPLVVLMLGIGLRPQCFLKPMRTTLDPMAAGPAKAFERQLLEDRPAPQTAQRGDKSRVD